MQLTVQCVCVWMLVRRDKNWFYAEVDTPPSGHVDVVLTYEQLLRRRLGTYQLSLPLGHRFAPYILSTFIDHRQSGVLFWSCLYVCMSVCLSDDNFRKPWRRKFIFALAVHLNGLRVEFVYESHRVKVKVTRAEKVENSYSRNVKLRSAIIPVLSYIEPWCLRAAWGFRVRQIEWCNRYLCHVTGSEDA